MSVETAGGAIVAEDAGAVERAGDQRRHVGQAAVVGRRDVGPDLRQSQVVELVVGEQRAAVAEAQLPLPEKIPRPFTSLAVSAALVARRVAIVARAAAHQLAHIGLDELAVVHEDRVHDQLIVRRHHLPRPVGGAGGLGLAGGGKAHGVRAQGVGQRRRRPALRTPPVLREDDVRQRASDRRSCCGRSRPRRSAAPTASRSVRPSWSRCRSWRSPAAARCA